MTRLVVPHNRFSAIDYFLQCCNPKEEKGVLLDVFAYNRMKEDPYLKKVDSKADEEEWFGEEVTIDGVYYPPLYYVLRKKTNNSYMVLKIKYGDNEYIYSAKEYSVEISYH